MRVSPSDHVFAVQAWASFFPTQIRAKDKYTTPAHTGHSHTNLLCAALGIHHHFLTPLADVQMGDVVRE